MDGKSLWSNIYTSKYFILGCVFILIAVILILQHEININDIGVIEKKKETDSNYSYYEAFNNWKKEKDISFSYPSAIFGKDTVLPGTEECNVFRFENLYGENYTTPNVVNVFQDYIRSENRIIKKDNLNFDFVNEKFKLDGDEVAARYVSRECSSENSQVKCITQQGIEVQSGSSTSYASRCLASDEYNGDIGAFNFNYGVYQQSGDFVLNPKSRCIGIEDIYISPDYRNNKIFQDNSNIPLEKGGGISIPDIDFYVTLGMIKFDPNMKADEPFKISFKNTFCDPSDPRQKLKLTRYALGGTSSDKPLENGDFNEDKNGLYGEIMFRGLNSYLDMNIHADTTGGVENFSIGASGHNYVYGTSIYYIEQTSKGTSATCHIKAPVDGSGGLSGSLTSIDQIIITEKGSCYVVNSPGTSQKILSADSSLSIPATISISEITTQLTSFVLKPKRYTKVDNITPFVMNQDSAIWILFPRLDMTKNVITMKTRGDFITSNFGSIDYKCTYDDPVLEGDNIKISNSIPSTYSGRTGISGNWYGADTEVRTGISVPMINAYIHSKPKYKLGEYFCPMDYWASVNSFKGPGGVSFNKTVYNTQNVPVKIGPPPGKIVIQNQEFQILTKDKNQVETPTTGDYWYTPNWPGGVFIPPVTNEFFSPFILSPYEQNKTNFQNLSTWLLDEILIKKPSFHSYNDFFNISSNNPDKDETWKDYILNVLKSNYNYLSGPGYYCNPVFPYKSNLLFESVHWTNSNPHNDLFGFQINNSGSRTSHTSYLITKYHDDPNQFNYLYMGIVSPRVPLYEITNKDVYIQSIGRDSDSPGVDYSDPTKPRDITDPIPGGGKLLEMYNTGPYKGENGILSDGSYTEIADVKLSQTFKSAYNNIQFSSVPQLIYPKYLLKLVSYNKKGTLNRLICEDKGNLFISNNQFTIFYSNYNNGAAGVKYTRGGNSKNLIYDINRLNFSYQGVPNYYGVENFPTQDSFSDGIGTFEVKNVFEDVFHFDKNYFLNTPGQVDTISRDIKTTPNVKPDPYAGIPPGIIVSKTQQVISLGDNGSFLTKGDNTPIPPGIRKSDIGLSITSSIHADQGTGLSAIFNIIGFPIEGDITPYINYVITNPGTNYSKYDPVTVNLTVNDNGNTYSTTLPPHVESERFLFKDPNTGTKNGSGLKFTAVLTWEEQDHSIENIEILERGEDYTPGDISVQQFYLSGEPTNTPPGNIAITITKVLNNIKYYKTDSRAPKSLFSDTNVTDNLLPVKNLFGDINAIGLSSGDKKNNIQMGFCISPQQLVYGGEIIPNSPLSHNRVKWFNDSLSLPEVNGKNLAAVSNSDKIINLFMSNEFKDTLTGYTKLDFFKSLQYKTQNYTSQSQVIVSDEEVLTLGRFIPYKVIDPNYYDRKKSSPMETYTNYNETEFIKYGTRIVSNSGSTLANPPNSFTGVSES